MVFASRPSRSRWSRNRASDLACARVADAVEPGVGAHHRPEPGVESAQGAEMELLRPAARCVHRRQFVQQRRLQHAHFAAGKRGAGAHLRERRRGRPGGERSGADLLQTVVRQPAALLVEAGVALLQGIEQIVIAGDADAGHGAEPVQVGVVGGGMRGGHRLVGPERGGDDHGECGVGGDAAVRGEVVGRVIGGADGAHVEVLEQAAHAQRIGGEQLVAAVVYGVGIGGRQQLADRERAAQLHVGPVVHRVADGVRHHLCPGPELGAVVGAAGDQLLVDAEGAHHPPLVVVAAEPHLGEVGEAVVVGDLLGRKMAVIVEDRHCARVVEVQAPGSVVAQQKVFAQEVAGHGGAILRQDGAEA